MSGQIFAMLAAGLVLLAGCVTPPDPQPPIQSQHVQQTSALVVSGSQTAVEELVLDGPLDVDSFVRLALQRNPEIIAAQRAVAAQAHVAPQVTALTDPVLSTTVQPFDNYSVQTAAGRGPNTLTIAQKLPWLDKLCVRGEVADEETKIALTRLAQSQIKVIEEVKLAYYEMAFVQAATQFIEHDQELLEQLLEVAEARYSTQQASQQDVLRAQVELARLEDRLITLRRRGKVAQADLAKVLHTSPEADLKTQPLETPPVPQQVDELYRAAVQSRPELQEQLHAVIRNERKRELARLDYYPDFNVGLGWQGITNDDAISPVSNGNDNLSVMFGMSVPIWRDKLIAGLHEAENRTMESARRYEATRDDTLRMIRRAIVQAESLQEQIETYEDRIIPKVEQALEVSSADYSVNKVDFQQVLDNWSDLLMFHLQAAQFKASLNQTLATLERVVGRQLATEPEVPENDGNLQPAAPPETDDSKSDDAGPKNGTDAADTDGVDAP